MDRTPRNGVSEWARMSTADVLQKDHNFTCVQFLHTRGSRGDMRIGQERSGELLSLPFSYTTNPFEYRAPALWFIVDLGLRIYLLAALATDFSIFYSSRWVLVLRKNPTPFDYATSRCYLYVQRTVGASSSCCKESFAETLSCQFCIFSWLQVP